MSKTYCRFCDIEVEGIYVNCPRCGQWLPPYPTADPAQQKTPAEPFILVSFGSSWSLSHQTVPTVTQFSDTADNRHNLSRRQQMAFVAKEFNIKVPTALAIDRAIWRIAPSGVRGQKGKRMIRVTIKEANRIIAEAFRADDKFMKKERELA